MHIKSEIINKMNTQNNIFSILNNIYSTNGRNKNYWKDLLICINNNSSFPKIIEFFNQRIKNEPSNILNLDILDFLIDYGRIDLLRELSKVDLMMNVFTLLRKSSGSGQEVQTKGIYLTKKWFDIANNKKENFEGFIKNYNDLQSKGIAFPPSGFKLNTYEQYISINEINNLLSNINSFNRQNNNENDFNNNFENIENINIINYSYKINNDTSTFESNLKHNNNNDDDIPSDDIPKLNNSNNYGNKINLDLMKTIRNDTILVNNDDNINIQNEINNNDFNNNISKENYLDNRYNKEKEESGNSKFVNRFDGKLNPYDNPFDNKPEEFNPFNENNNEPMETSVYPDYNEKEINENNKYKNKNFGNNLNCEPTFNTPYGNINKMPNENKNYKTIYNCGFKSYMEEAYGIKNKNYNNTFNNNVHNNNYNNYYNNQGNNYNNIPNENNQMKINQNHNMNNSNNATFLYKHSWVVKISLYNQWMNYDSTDTNLQQLKSAIKNLINEYDKIESLLQKYNREEDFESVSIISKLKSDMDQTCYRFEKLISNQPYEDFYSAFDGNNTVYCFNKEFILSYLENSENNDNKYFAGLKKIGGVMKKGIFAAGKVVKETTVKGINYVKEKVHKDNNISNRYNNKNNINDFTYSSDNYYNQNYNNYNHQNNYNNNQFNNFNNNQNYSYNRNFY